MLAKTQDNEEIIERVAALDIGKAELVCCVRVPDEDRPRRRGRKKAVVAIGRSILVIIWHLLTDPSARYTDLGSDFYDTRINPERRRRNHVRQLEALGYKVLLERAA